MESFVAFLLVLAISHPWLSSNLNISSLYSHCGALSLVPEGAEQTLLTNYCLSVLTCLGGDRRTAAQRSLCFLVHLEPTQGRGCMWQALLRTLKQNKKSTASWAQKIKAEVYNRVPKAWEESQGEILWEIKATKVSVYTGKFRKHIHARFRKELRRPKPLQLAALQAQGKQEVRADRV